MRYRHVTQLLWLPLLVAAFNIFVNPYDQWQLPRWPGINDKITEGNQDFLIKLNQIRRNHYDTIILGSSRSAIAFSPDHAALAGDKTYNYGLSGAGVYLQYATLQHTLTRQPLRRIIITPDFFGFNAHLALNQPEKHGHRFIKQRMLPESSADTWLDYAQQSRELMEHHIGWQGTNSSIRTLLSQNMPTVYINEQGHWQRFGTKDRDYKRQYDRTEKVFLTDWLFPAPAYRYDFQDEATGYDSFAVYRQLLTLAHQHELEGHLILLPTPDRNLLAMQKLGLWEKYTFWKKTLVMLNDQVASEFQRTPYPIWDFETGEANTGSDDLETLRPYFYEPMHPTPLVGEQILNRVFLDCTRLVCWPGRPLNSATVDSSLRELGDHLVTYQKLHPRQMQALQKNIEKTNPQRHPVPITNTH